MMVCMNLICAQCEATFVATGRRGITPRFCSARCRQRAHRARTPKCPLPDALGWARAAGKRPVTPGGAPASSTDPGTWSSWADVQRGAGDGFGVMLGGGLGCYDLDGCLDDGELSGWARETVAGIPERVVFVERSVSGRGLHVFVEASPAPGLRRDGVERYTRDRFIRVTGDEFLVGVSGV